MNDNDGGPAFPVPQLMTVHGEIVNSWATGGMSLRDYFAAKALQGALASFAHPQIDLGAPTDWKQTARDCYAVADAMLAARKDNACPSN